MDYRYFCSLARNSDYVEMGIIEQNELLAAWKYFLEAVKREEVNSGGAPLYLMNLLNGLVSPKRDRWRRARIMFLAFAEIANLTSSQRLATVLSHFFSGNCKEIALTETPAAFGAWGEALVRSDMLAEELATCLGEILNHVPVARRNPSLFAMRTQQSHRLIKHLEDLAQSIPEIVNRPFCRDNMRLGHGQVIRLKDRRQFSPSPHRRMSRGRYRDIQFQPIGLVPKYYETDGIMDRPDQCFRHQKVEDYVYDVRNICDKLERNLRFMPL